MGEYRERTVSCRNEDTALPRWRVLRTNHFNIVTGSHDTSICCTIPARDYGRLYVQSRVKISIQKTNDDDGGDDDDAKLVLDLARFE